MQGPPLQLYQQQVMSQRKSIQKQNRKQVQMLTSSQDSADQLPTVLATANMQQTAGGGNPRKGIVNMSH